MCTYSYSKGPPIHIEKTDIDIIEKAIKHKQTFVHNFFNFSSEFLFRVPSSSLFHAKLILLTISMNNALTRQIEF